MSTANNTTMTGIPSTAPGTVPAAPAGSQDNGSGAQKSVKTVTTTVEEGKKDASTQTQGQTSQIVDAPVTTNAVPANMQAEFAQAKATVNN